MSQARITIRTRSRIQRRTPDPQPEGGEIAVCRSIYSDCPQSLSVLNRTDQVRVAEPLGIPLDPTSADGALTLRQPSR
jgi:hypothetical protein